MFGIFNLTREDEEQGTRKTDDNKNNDDLCYGGFFQPLEIRGLPP